MTLWGKEIRTSRQGGLFFRSYLGRSVQSIDWTADGIRYRWREAMTYIARTRQWVSRSTVQRSRSSPGHTLCSQGATLSDMKAVFVCVRAGMSTSAKAGFLSLQLAFTEPARTPAVCYISISRCATCSQYWSHVAINWMSYGCWTRTCMWGNWSI